MVHYLRALVVGGLLAAGCRDAVAPPPRAEGDLEVFVPSGRPLTGREGLRVEQGAPTDRPFGAHVALDPSPFEGPFFTDNWTATSIDAGMAYISSGATYWGTSASQNTHTTFTKNGQTMMQDDLAWEESHALPLAYTYSVFRELALSTPCGMTMNSVTGHIARLSMLSLPLMTISATSGSHSTQPACPTSGAGGGSPTRDGGGYVLTICQYEAILDQYGEVWYIEERGCQVYAM